MAVGIGGGYAAFVVGLLTWLFVRERRKRRDMQEQVGFTERSLESPVKHLTQIQTYPFPPIEAAAGLSPQELPGTTPWSEAP